MDGTQGPERVDILGVGVSALTMPLATATMQRWIAGGERHYVCITGVHGVMESQRDPALMAIHNGAGMVTPDGMPLVWMARRLGHPEVERVYGPDLMRAMCGLSAARGYRNFLYGSRPRTLAALAAAITAAHPGLPLAGSLSPPFRALSPAEEEAEVAAINAARPDIVWVGLSTPKQERWMARNRDRLEAAVHGRRRRRLRLPGRGEAAGAALDAAPRPGMGLPHGLRAAPAGRPLPPEQPGLRLARDAPAGGGGAAGSIGGYSLLPARPGPAAVL